MQFRSNYISNSGNNWIRRELCALVYRLQVRLWSRFLVHRLTATLHLIVLVFVFTGTLKAVSWSGDVVSVRVLVVDLLVKLAVLIVLFILVEIIMLPVENPY